MIQRMHELLDPISVAMVSGKVGSNLFDTLVVLCWVFDRVK